MEEVINELMKMSLRYCFRLLVQMNYLVMRRGLCFLFTKHILLRLMFTCVFVDGRNLWYLSRMETHVSNELQFTSCAYLPLQSSKQQRFEILSLT